jgi:predicted nucleotidyltransferase
MDERFEPLATTYGLRLILQFGSTIRGTTHARSDVDIAALFEHAPAFDAELALIVELQRLYPGLQVDFAVLNRADPLFLKQILDGCRLLYGSPRALAELRLYAFRRYQDHRRYLALEREYVDRSIRRLAAR